MQKRMLLQVPEQRESAENEIRHHQLVSHDNVIRLFDSEIKDIQNGEGLALLVFPYYQVSLYIYIYIIDKLHFYYQNFLLNWECG